MLGVRASLDYSYRSQADRAEIPLLTHCVKKILSAKEAQDMGGGGGSAFELLSLDWQTLTPLLYC